MSDPIRFDIPNPQVKDTADQFFDGSKKLDVVMGGTLMPMLHCGAIAIELFMKALSAQHDDVPEGDGWVQRHAKPTRGHTLADRLAALEADVRDEIESAFRKRFPGEELTDMLSDAEDVFMPSRYPYEAGSALPENCVGLIRKLGTFLSEFVAKMEPRHILVSPKG